jgi:hypothetical protein
VFLLSAMAGVLVAAGCERRESRSAGLSESAAPGWLATTVGDSGAAARLGRLYLEVHPQERDLDALVAGIDAATTPELASGSTGVDQMLVALQRAVRGDYIRDRVVSVRGWVLSRTEARVYAALALATQE